MNIEKLFSAKGEKIMTTLAEKMKVFEDLSIQLQSLEQEKMVE